MYEHCTREDVPTTQNQAAGTSCGGWIVPDIRWLGRSVAHFFLSGQRERLEALQKK